MSINTVVEITFGRVLTEAEEDKLHDLLIEALDNNLTDDWMSIIRKVEFDDEGDEVVNNVQPKE